jgi:hypothetical protein
VEAAVGAGISTVLDKAGLSVLKPPLATGASTLGTGGEGCVNGTLCASAGSGELKKAAKITIVDGALHMNFPLLEQAQVCNLELITAIVRMTHGLFTLGGAPKMQSKKLPGGGCSRAFLQTPDR